MRVRFVLFLCLLLAFAAIAPAQDTTCNPGDIAWVKETVEADVGHTTGATGAEYNNFAAPFGIQRVYDQSCAGLDVRFLCGADDYDSTTPSWTNRDTNEVINIDTVANPGTGSPIRTTGYANETTPATAAIPCGLNFATGASHGFNVARQRHSFRFLRVYNAAADGFSIAGSGDGSQMTLYGVTLDNNGSDGVEQSASNLRIWFSKIHTNTAHGVNQQTSLLEVRYSEITGNGENGILTQGTGSYIVDNRISGNGAGVASRANLGSHTGTQVDWIFRRNWIEDATGAGIQFANTSTFVIEQNIIRGSSGAGIFQAAATAASQGVIAGNVIAENTGFAVNWTSTGRGGDVGYLNNQFFDNAGGDSINSGDAPLFEEGTATDALTFDVNGFVAPPAPFGSDLPAGEPLGEVRGISDTAGGAGGGANVAY